MIDRTAPSEQTSFARLDALARRSRPRGFDSRAAGFEALLADAASRSSKAIEAGVIAKFDTRPKGALGMATLASPAAIPRSAQSSEPSSTQSVEPSQAAATQAVAVDPAITQAIISAAGDAVLAAAMEQVGAPYLTDANQTNPRQAEPGQTNPQSAFDDAGLVKHSFSSVGVDIPPNGSEQARMGVAIESLAGALPGDLLSFGDPVDHVALYAGEGRMIHAPSAGEVVRIENIERPVASIRRVVAPGAKPVEPSAPVAVSLGGPTGESFVPSEAERGYQALFESAGQEWDIPAALLAAIAETESGFNPSAVSPVGAQGLMQFMPATAREMDVDPLDPASAIDGAARYLRTSLDRFERPDLAIASYNAGRGAVAKHGGIPPFTETQNYVRKVLDAWRSRS